MPENDVNQENRLLEANENSAAEAEKNAVEVDASNGGDYNIDSRGNVIYAAPEPKKLSLFARRLIKFSIIIGMLIILQIPLLLVSCQVESRAERQEKVKDEIAAAWGKEQIVYCDMIVTDLDADVEISSEMRRRGIYEVPVYTAEVKIAAKYDAAGRDFITLRVSDMKGFEKIEVSVNGAKKKCKISDDGIVIPVQRDEEADIDVSMRLRGCDSFTIRAFGADSKIKISGDWEDPGFTGAVLPVSRSVKDDKFSAEWHISKSSGRQNCDTGVNLCVIGGSYQQVERTITYATLFLVIFFFTLFIGEILAKQEIHPLQYVVASGAPVLFYLLLLALSEHTGFNLAYLISAAAVVLMVTGYARMFMGKLKPALIMGIVFVLSYLLNFFILRMEDFALLSGTVVLLLILGVMMFITGKINRKDSEAEEHQ